ncbi:PF11185 family protein [Leptospira wolbachii serovar Codice str. CDC]|uniref:PF11185 family protein n=1 Tax=Leptospira wolbachii serovar Codice str. CDC TaxID=1218599 RepID=R9A850_9LEPT|nr:DUF2971 domain-containing protein [Leptospira wolbachii]EOQ98272.1 PF11185 family protein [Leptospira wolbachii serovar Codice str. CDC]
MNTFEKIIEIFKRKTEEIIIPQVNPKEIYHYTDINGVKGILESRRIWASDVRYLNDPSETTYFHNLIKEKIENSKLTGILEELLNTTRKFIEQHHSEAPRFVTSFCIEKDLLSQWRYYSKESIGYMIAFDTMSLLKGIKNPLFFYTVIYNRKDQDTLINKLIESAEEILNSNNITKEFLDDFKMSFIVALLMTMLIIKHPDYSEEKEARITYTKLYDRNMELDTKFRINQGMFVPYIEVPIPDVKIKGIYIERSILGEKAAESLLLYLKENKLDIPVTLGKTPIGK